MVMWERAKTAARSGNPLPETLPDDADWDRPCSLADPTAEQTVLVPGNQLTDLLLAGGVMAEWFLEERGQVGAPGWCLCCGRRGSDMRKAEFHGLGCSVGLWLRTTEGIENKGQDVGQDGG